MKTKFEFVGVLCRGQHLTREISCDALPRVGEIVEIEEDKSSVFLFFKVDNVFHRVCKEAPHTVNKIVVMGRLMEM